MMNHDAELRALRQAYQLLDTAEQRVQFLHELMDEILGRMTPEDAHAFLTEVRDLLRQRQRPH